MQKTENIKKLQKDKKENKENKWIKTVNTNRPSRLPLSTDNFKNDLQTEGLCLDDLDHSSSNRSPFQNKSPSISYNDFLYNFNKDVKKKIERTENKQFYVVNLQSSINHNHR